MSAPEIRELARTELTLAAELLSRGMRDNPVHISALGADAEHRCAALASMFEPLLRQYLGKGFVLGAFDGGALTGVCAMVRPGRCRGSAVEKLRLFRGLIRGAGLTGSLRVIEWVNAWESQDPAVPHWHLGPVAVDTHLQGRGIGTAMLTEFCRRVDLEGIAAYLETDKSENVSFYLKFGFETTGGATILGVPNWFMLRAIRAEGTLDGERRAADEKDTLAA
jgi:ribosomal protein S18 acetylase RimI-like enzyme